MENEKTKDEYQKPIMDAPPLEPIKQGLPDILNPSEMLASITRWLYQYTLSPRYKKWYLLVLAVIAFVVGYKLFFVIVGLERLIPDFSFTSSRDLLAMTAIDQVVLGTAVLTFFVISRKYYFSLFVYAGFLFQYISVIRHTQVNFPLTPVSFLPVFIYAIAGIILTIGLKFGKKTGLVLAILINILFLANYNSKLMTGYYLDFRDIFYTTENREDIGQIVSKLTELASQNQNCEIEKISGRQTHIALNRCANPTSQFLTVNDKPQKSYYAVDKITVSPDGKSIAYFAYEKVGQTNIKDLFVINGKEYELISPVPQEIDADGIIQTDFVLNNIIFSPDSRHFAYTGYFRGGEDVYLDGGLFKSYRHKKVNERTGEHCEFYAPVSDLQFSSNNKLLYLLSKPADLAYSDCEDALIIDGAEYDAYPSIGKFVISSDGLKIAYAGYEEGKPVEETEFSQGRFYLIINKEKFKTFSFPNEKIYDLRFSDNGQAICYTLGSPQASAKLRSAYVIVNNKEREFPVYGQSGEDFLSFCEGQSKKI